VLLWIDLTGIFFPILDIWKQFCLISQESYDFLREYKGILDHNLKQPRLIIYIDKSPEEIWERMKREGKDYQKNSKVYSLELLKAMDTMYKEEFLPRMSMNSHILQYREEDINIEDVVFDIEELNFDDTTKFKDWRVSIDLQIEQYRALLHREAFWIKLFNMNRLTKITEWWTEQNVDIVLRNQMKYDHRYHHKTNKFDIKPFLLNERSWSRLPFY